MSVGCLKVPGPLVGVPTNNYKNKKAASLYKREVDAQVFKGKYSK